MITALIDSLHKAQLDFSAEELADVLWLAAKMGAPSFANADQFIVRKELEEQARRQEEQTSNRHDIEATRQFQDNEPSIATVNNQTQQDQARESPEPISSKSFDTDQKLDGKGGASVYLSGKSEEGLPFHAPGVSSLPNSLQLARSLRPLIRRVPSNKQMILDEEKTAHNSADSEHLLFALRPSPERWLDLVLIVDESPSMILWRQTVAAFRLILESLGTFRNLEMWYFNSHTNDKQFYLYPSRIALANRSDARDARQISLQGQRLILLISDCVGQAWYSGVVAKVCNQWGWCGLVNLVQVLPRRLWARTALKQSVPVYLHSRQPGTVNSKLEVEMPLRWRLRNRSTTDLAIPVMTLDETSLATWSQLMVGTSARWSPGVILPTNPEQEDYNPQDNLQSFTPQQRIQRFFAVASPQAQKLAVYSSANPVLSLPMIRLIQRKMLEESTQAHLAEFICSDLVEQITPYDAVLSSDDIRYEFTAGIRDLLLDGLRQDDTVNVLELVFNALSAFINTQTGKSVEFRTVIANPTLIEQIDLTKNGVPFALLAISTLNRLGGNYRKLASQLENHKTNNHSANLTKYIDKAQTACNKIVATLANPRHRKTLPAIEQWLNQLPPNLRSHPKLQAVVMQAFSPIVEKFVAHARNNLKNFKDLTSKESAIQARLDRLSQEISMADSDIRQPLDDLKFVVNYLFRTGSFQAHKFVDAVLAGAYANLAWAEETLRGEVAQLLEDLPRDLLAEAEAQRELLVGAFQCEQVVQTTLRQLPTLLHEVADDYVTQRYREVYQDRYAWWTGVTGTIDATYPDKPALARWCEGKRNEKARYEDNRQRIELGLPPRRLLWPLEISIGIITPPDANYDFPSIAERIDDIATQTPYALGSGQAARHVSAFELCQDYLSQYTHHIVTGNPKVGKSWLRLYLEYFSLVTDERLLPLFYFAPATLAYQTTILEIAENLARTVANQLFADLLVRSGNRTPTNDPWRASRIAIAPFLHRYGYTPPNNHDSLVQPIPPKHLLDIELAYGNSYLAPIYTQMKQEIDAVSAAVQAVTGTFEEIFEEIQRAIELVGYQSIFVLIDNWDDLPTAPRRRLLNYLLQPDLLAELYRRGIFLKLFMPELSNTGLAHFDLTCEIQRGAVHRLALYTYRDSNA